MESDQGRHRGLVIFAIFVLGCALSYSLGRVSGQLDEKEALMSQPLPDSQPMGGVASDRPTTPDPKGIQLGSAQ